MVNSSGTIHICLIFLKLKKATVPPCFTLLSSFPFSFVCLFWWGVFASFVFFTSLPKNKTQPNLKQKSYDMLESKPLEVSLVWGFFFARVYYSSSEGVTV